MKLTLPPIEIGEDEGFDPSKDIFDRKGFGERLISLIESSNENLVLALDAQWGEGKSTFVKMWRGHIAHHRESKIKSIYFDAFANDYQKDPFLALVSEIYGLLEDEPKEKKEFKREAVKAAKILARGAIKIGVKYGSSGLIDDTIVDGAKKDISKLLSDQVDNIIADRFKSANKDKVAIIEFREYLKLLAEKIGGGKPIVFVIDELDRCRPDFALELLEQIKHLFSVEGISFLLVMNREQLEEYVKTKYGVASAELFLQKFINMWFTLPRKAEEYGDHGIEYFNYALGKMLEAEELVENKEAIAVLKDLLVLKQPSYRQIERILTSFALIHNMSGDTKYNIIYQYLMAFLCYLKSEKSQLFERIRKKLATPDSIIKEAGLENVSDGSSVSLYDLKNHIIFDLADDEKRNEMVSSKEIYLGSFNRNPGRGVMAKVCNWFAEIERRD